MAAGSFRIENNDGVTQILRILKDHFAPEAIDAVFKDVGKFEKFKRTDQSLDTYLLEFEVLRHKAEARMEMGSGFPEEHAAFLVMKAASLSQRDKSLVLPVSMGA